MSANLPREVLEREISLAEKLGEEFKFNARIGADLTLDDLFGQGYGADRLVREMDSVPSANIALVAFTCSHPRFPFLPARVREAIIRISPDGSRPLSLDILRKVTWRASRR